GAVPALAVMLERNQRASVEITQAAKRFRLTPRVTEALELLTLGYNTKEIASQMGISPNTAKTLLRSIMFKIGARERSGILVKILQFAKRFARYNRRFQQFVRSRWDEERMHSRRKRRDPRHAIRGKFEGAELPSLQFKRKGTTFKGQVSNVSDGGFCLLAPHAPRQSVLLQGPLKFAGLPAEIPTLV